MILLTGGGRPAHTHALIIKWRHNITKWCQTIIVLMDMSAMKYYLIYIHQEIISKISTQQLVLVFFKIKFIPSSAVMLPSLPNPQAQWLLWLIIKSPLTTPPSCNLLLINRIKKTRLLDGCSDTGLQKYIDYSYFERYEE